MATIEMPTTGGRSMRLADTRGKIVMLHFLASWCGECAMESPSLANLRQSFEGTPFEIVGVAIDSDPFEMQTFAARYNVRYPLAIDTTGEMKEFFGIKQLPTTIFLDKTGIPIRFQDPDSKEITAKLIGARKWDSEAPVRMIAGMVEAG